MGIYTKYVRTCSIFEPKSNSVTFAKSLEALEGLKDFDGDIFVFVPNDLNIDTGLFGENVEFFKFNRDIMFYHFVQVHNEINKDILPAANKIGSNCKIDPTVVMDIDGINIARNSDGRKTFVKHIGNVEIGDDVYIDAYTTIHRSIFSSTKIGSGTVISTHVNIAHNCDIGKDVFIGPGVKIAGSVKIGDNCTIWQGVLIKNGISICEDVTIGMGSVVTKSISEPGVYYGTPCVKAR